MSDIQTRFAPEIDASLVRRLIAAQFPQWAKLPIRAAEPQGWDNRTFRLGNALGVRLPSAARYVAQVEKEQRWLPRLAPQLPLPIPAPVAVGAAGEGYPWPWSIYRWIEGAPAAHGVEDLPAFASDLGAFLAALQAIDTGDGPAAGPHSFWRGGPLATYDGEARAAIAELGERIDGGAASEVWKAALAATWDGPPVWVHGDMAVANLLLRGGRLGAVIDFGCCAVGDPACDLVLAWTLFEGESRAAFQSALPLDPATWARGRGWALWKAAVSAARAPADSARNHWRVIEAVLSDASGSG
ncbi:MAG TPA: aminoglycoside phosphotransferase family protein [Caulobacteraceae bacterium]|nr:aminoglycoside phosphotransferase family protein [Caulobacteraceae bacterium]